MEQAPSTTGHKAETPREGAGRRVEVEAVNETNALYVLIAIGFCICAGLLMELYCWWRRRRERARDRRLYREWKKKDAGRTPRLPRK